MWGALARDGSAEVAKYEKMVRAHARRYSRMPGLEGHEDDFVQEGLIAVWESLQAGRPPSNEYVLGAMRNYAQVERRKGHTGYQYDEESDTWIPRFEGLNDGLEDPRA